MKHWLKTGAIGLALFLLIVPFVSAENLNPIINSFETINAPAGTDPVAESETDTLNLTSSDSSVTITGDASTNTLNFQAAAGAPTWGSIAGTLSNQTDLQGALNAKEDAFTPGDLTSDTDAISVTDGVGSLVSDASITCAVAGAAQDGCLDSDDWTAFDDKLGLLNGLSGSSQTFSTGSTGTDFNISSASTTHTFNIPDASGSARGVVTTEAQTFAGTKTFSSAPVLGSLTGVLSASSGTLAAGDVDLTSQVSGALPLANGGTGQTSQTAAFDALAPTTTKGDLIISDGSDNVRFPVCADGEVLEAASGEDTGWDCGTAGGSGDVTGPASSLDNYLPSFDGTTGKVIQSGTGLSNPASGQLRVESSAAKIYMDAGTTNYGFKRGSGNSLEWWIFSGSENYHMRLEQTDFYLRQANGEMWLGQLGSGTGYLISAVNGNGFNNAYNLTVRGGNNSPGGNDFDAGDLTVQGGDNNGSNAGADGGDLTVRGGDAASGAAGNLNLREGVSTGGADGIVTIGDATAQNTHRLNISTESAGANTATLTNSPATAGDPDIWVRININGTDYVMPAWEAP